MKYIHLVLYNKDPLYDEMKEITEKYYNSFDNVTTFYYCYNNDIDIEYKLEDNILYIKGVETYSEGCHNETSILEKTIKAFEFIKNYNFDYIVRSNVSTIINFKLLDEELINNPLKYYTGGLLRGHSVNNIKTKNGTFKNINEVQYIHGSAIILDNLGLNFLLDNKDELEQYMDDISIGILFTTHCDYFKINKLKDIGHKFIFTHNIIINNDIIKNNNIFYRNKWDFDRNSDIIKMKQIINIIKSN